MSEHTGPAQWYDLVYGEKPYQAEVQRLHALIAQHNPPLRTLLDVGCGTGRHIGFLSEWYTCAGSDASAPMIAIARERHPGTEFYVADMRDLDLERRFGVVTCMFGAIAHADLRESITRMAAHLEPGGILVIEPWRLAELPLERNFRIRRMSRPDLTVVRMGHCTPLTDGRVLLVFDFMVDDASALAVIHHTERLILRRHTVEEHLAAARTAGLSATYNEPDDLFPMGLIIGTK
jgi:SAM-dependent methyltransferase